jgi:L-ascorbate metabolism protein UlaG (beta-lactamase superfamily)
MSHSITWHGHSTFSLVTEKGKRAIIDPFLSGNPKADILADEFETLDDILCTHGHGDHIADAIPLAKRTGAMVIAAYELAGFAASQGAPNTHGLGIGGGHMFEGFGYVKLTPALHGGAVEGAEGKVVTPPSGVLIDMDGKRLYHAGDTALTMDMQLLRGIVDVALLPIGDNYTMGPQDAARAVEFIEPTFAIPMHYNTWDVIAQDPQDFARRVGSKTTAVILEPGQKFTF